MINWDVFVFVSFCWTLMISLQYLTFANCECCAEMREKPANQKLLRNWRRLNIASAGACILFVFLDLYSTLN